MNTLKRVRVRLYAAFLCRASETYTVSETLHVNGDLVLQRTATVVGTNDPNWTEEIGYGAHAFAEAAVEMSAKCWVEMSVARSVNGFSQTEFCPSSGYVRAAFDVLDETKLFSRQDEEHPPVELDPPNFLYESVLGWTGAFSWQLFVGDDCLDLEGCSDVEDPGSTPDTDPDPPVDPPPPPAPDPDPPSGPDTPGPGQGNLPASRQFITSMINMATEDGASRLIVGTRGRLYVDTGDGNWQMVLAITSLCGDGSAEETAVPYGRFLVDVIGNMLFAAHTEAGFWTWAPGNPFYQDEHGVYASAEPVDDLIALDISQARAVCASNGFILVGNYVESGVRKSGSIIISDFNGPRRFVPGGNGLSIVVSLGDEQEILAIKRLGDGVRVLTSTSIWVGAMVGGDEVWRFIRLEDVSPADSLAYPFSVVNTGGELVYIGHDAILVLDKNDPVPRRIAWLQDAASAAFDGVQEGFLDGVEEGLGMPARCPIRREVPWMAISVFDATRRIVMFFWPSEGSDVPDTGLAIDMTTAASCVLDFGATAGCPVKPVWRTTWRRFLSGEGLCDPAPDINEGEPLPIEYNPSTAEYLVHPLELTGMFPALDLRDVDLEEDAPNSWYVLATSQGRCCNGCPPVSADMQTVLASPVDKCLKVIAEGYFGREVVSNTVSPTWADEGAEDGKVASEQTPPEGSEWPPNHPTTVLSEGDVAVTHYGWMWASDASDFGTIRYKSIQDIAVSYSSQLQSGCQLAGGMGVDPEEPWTIWAQAASGFSIDGLIWRDDDPQPVHYHAEAEPDEGSFGDYDGGPGPMAFRFEATGVYVAFRIGGGGYREDGPPLGPFAISSVTGYVPGASCTW